MSVEITSTMVVDGGFFMFLMIRYSVYARVSGVLVRLLTSEGCGRRR